MSSSGTWATDNTEIVLTGASGLMGHALVRSLASHWAVVPARRCDLDITDHEAVRRYFGTVRPAIIVHSAANANPDDCQLRPEDAYAVNVLGTKYIVEACLRYDSALAFISSDAVFGGDCTGSYTEESPTNPINVYGRTKREAEMLVSQVPRHYIFRLSVLFGPGKAHLITRALGSIKAGTPIRAAVDQIATTTYTLDAALTIRDILARAALGTYHITNSGPCTRFDIVRAAAADAGLSSENVIPVSISDFNRPAPRASRVILKPAYLQRRGFPVLRGWQSAVSEYVRSLQPWLLGGELQ